LGAKAPLIPHRTAADVASPVRYTAKTMWRKNSVISPVLLTKTCRNFISVHATRPVQQEQGSSAAVIYTRTRRPITQDRHKFNHNAVLLWTPALLFRTNVYNISWRLECSHNVLRFHYTLKF